MAWQRREPLTAYAMGLRPELLAIMALNTLLYGGPLTSGYGSLFELYGFGALPVNVRNYLVWLVQTQTPLILLALVPLFVRGALRERTARVSPRACLAALVGADVSFVSVLRDVRSLVLSALPAAGLSRRCSCCWRRRSVAGADGCRSRRRVPAAAIVCVAMMSFGVNVGSARAASSTPRAYERRHIRAARGSRVADAGGRDRAGGPAQRQRAILRRSNHAAIRLAERGRARRRGSRRGGEGLARISRRRRLGREGVSRAVFAGNRAAQLDWRPIARVPGSPEVRIFELQDGGPAPTQ